MGNTGGFRDNSVGLWGNKGFNENSRVIRGNRENFQRKIIQGHRLHRKRLFNYFNHYNRNILYDLSTQDVSEAYTIEINYHKKLSSKIIGKSTYKEIKRCKSFIKPGPKIFYNNR